MKINCSTAWELFSINLTFRAAPPCHLLLGRWVLFLSFTEILFGATLTYFSCSNPLRPLHVCGFFKMYFSGMELLMFHQSLSFYLKPGSYKRHRSHAFLFLSQGNATHGPGGHLAGVRLHHWWLSTVDDVTPFSARHKCRLCRRVEEHMVKGACTWALHPWATVLLMPYSLF